MMADEQCNNVTEASNMAVEEATNMVAEEESSVVMEAESTLVTEEENNVITDAESNIVTEEAGNTIVEKTSNSDEADEKISEESVNNMEEHKHERERFRKLFIGNLRFTSTEESLKSHFEQWGDIVDCIVMRVPHTERSRGFGFITYKTSQMVDDAQDARPHKIDGRIVETKRAVPREDSGKPEAQATVETLFVGKLKEEVEEEDLREYFGKYGKIVRVNVATDRSTGKKKGFAFITFDDYDPVDKVVLLKNHSLKGKRALVQRALPREGYESFRRGPRAPRGGGRASGYKGGYDGRRPMGNHSRYGGTDYRASDYGSVNQGDDYGYRYGGGPMRNNGFYERSQAPYGRGI